MLIATPRGEISQRGVFTYGHVGEVFFAFLEGLLEPSHNDGPEIFGMFGRPYDGDGMMTDEQYREYMAAHDGNQWGSGAYNHRTGMWDNGGDDAGIYDDNNWLPGPIGTYDEDNKPDYAGL